jgi:hypothetical protein
MMPPVTAAQRRIAEVEICPEFARCLLAVNPLVGGSNPSRGASEIINL